ncbi:MAG: DUF3147 family protein [bacterium]
MNLFIKIVISALLIGAISEISRRNTAIAALLAALPLISILSMIWIYSDFHDVNRIASFSWSVFWYVLPSLIMFVLLPILITKWQMSFYMALTIASVAAVTAFFILKTALKPFGVNL